MKEFPDVTPPILSAKVEIIGMGYVFYPAPDGPLAMLLSKRADTGEKVTFFVATDVVTQEETQAPCGCSTVDPSRIDPDLICRVVFPEWPLSWPSDSKGFVIADLLVSQLRRGFDWMIIKKQLERASVINQAKLN